jgi:FAD synthetase
MNTATGFAEPLVNDTPPPFPELCARIHDRIAAFLDVKDGPGRLRGVQEQTRTSLRVIEEALARYRWADRHVLLESYAKLTVTGVYQSSH